MHIGSDILSVVEPVLLGATWLVFTKRKAQREYPAFGAYLAFRALLLSALTVLLHVARIQSADKHLLYSLYYYLYWLGFLAGAGMAFLVIQEVFEHLMEPLTGLGRYGVMVFRWVSLTSGLIALMLAVFPLGPNKGLLVSATGGAMRCISALELCLLAFIVLSMQTLRIAPRSRDFGVALGLALIAAADLFGAGFAFSHSYLASIASYCSAGVTALAAIVWLAYFLRPESVVARLPMKLSSHLERLNEIAGALGQPAPQIVISSPADFFLQDVERAVDRVLKKNSLSAD